MNYFSIHREPFRAEQKLSSFIIGAAKHLILLFHPKGFSVLKELVIGAWSKVSAKCNGTINVIGNLQTCQRVRLILRSKGLRAANSYILALLLVGIGGLFSESL